MSTLVTWLLIVVGALLVLCEVVMGAISGFDFLLIGSALLLGGLLGLLTQQPLLGLIAAGLLSLLYILIGRRRIRSRLRRPGIPSNTDALLDREVVVVESVSEDHAGRIRHDGEVWRALLDARGQAPGGALAPGAKARITRVDGVTVYVVPAAGAAASRKEPS
jgi:membrane protein implicated in regulation of membrane protease activity